MTPIDFVVPFIGILVFIFWRRIQRRRAERIASNIENQTETLENESIVPIYETNWCDMPAEIKLECIGRMEIRERLSLRCAAKSERSLVDSQKVQISRGTFYRVKLKQGMYSSSTVVSLHFNKQDTFTKHFVSDYEAFELMKHILKIGIFEDLEISFSNSFTNYKESINDVGEISATNIEISGCNKETVFAILRKLKNGVESIMMTFGAYFYEDSLDEILAIPHVQNARYWHLKNLKHSWIPGFEACEVAQVAQMWIDKNSKIGSTFQASLIDVLCQTYRLFNEFVKYFDDRIVFASEKRIRIRTNNPDRHILLERGLDDVMEIYDDLQFYRMMVISAEMKESEYDDDCKTWILKMEPQYYNDDSENSFEQYDYNSSDGSSDFADDWL
ncbi:hypothetical protein B9Z55_012793 [Caenorhabditis nigoni]|uniref:F-box domain-containing protein n=1 Tax=Caenorhabditis nigoni TaxID=1611254 RepID=A0A2G5TYZ9_9PELO|nr:hypothetical protein B9Z55_012793 [Caenorhabditis nigoni]